MAWELERGDETLRIDPPGRLIVGVNAAAAAIDAACEGLGVIATFENWLEPHLRAGSLLPVLQEWWPVFDGPRLYFFRRFMPAPLRAFIDFVTAESSPSLMPSAGERRG